MYPTKNESVLSIRRPYVFIQSRKFPIIAGKIRFLVYVLHVSILYLYKECDYCGNSIFKTSLEFNHAINFSFRRYITYSRFLI